ncbi:MAG: hypothetical protein A2910_03280 [Candidatus Yanofskybacteria bacterium RIFCSPLOWO2_01_FULL_39_28]|nr:MAG: hypothetical protein A2910_03280 [Candidatus Yanofskybacteria bacterium RIFCSPLOWO2_01_FULL_39_28]
MKFVFGANRAIFGTVMAFITPMWRDDKLGKKQAQAHVYLEDWHGRGKTAILTHLSSALRADISKFVGTIDMMPKDLIGKEERDVITGTRTLMKGPLHCHVLAYDELTRTPAKSLTALLTGMEGAHVMMNTTDPNTGIIKSEPYPLYPVPGDPKGRDFFIVLATSNPIELEGTFPLSPAQQDRFTYRFKIGLPPREDEMRIESENVVNEKVEVIGDLSDLLDIAEMVDSLRLSDQARELVQRYNDNSRPYSQDIEDFGEKRKRYADSSLVEFINKYVACGCSPRRNYHLKAAAKAYAWMTGENEVVLAEHVKAIAPSVMQHVFMLQPSTLSDDVSPRKIVERILAETWIPK